MNTIEKNTKVVLNTPIDLDLAQFGAINNTKNIHKLIWLIHQINKYTISDGKLKMHKETYYKFLGLSPKDLNMYLNILKGAGLIEQTKIGNNITETLSEFVILEPFEPVMGNKHTYDISSTKCPLFIRKWVADGYAVRGLSNYKKPIATKKTKALMIPNANEIIAELELLRNQVDQLKIENEELKQENMKLIAKKNYKLPEPIMAKPLKPNDEVTDIKPTSEAITEYTTNKGVKISLVDAGKYSDYIIQQLLRRYNQFDTTLRVFDENKTLIWFTNKDHKIQHYRTFN